MEKLTKLWKFIFANLDTVVALLVSVLATTFGIMQNNQGLLLAGIALTLTFLSLGLIRDRLNREILSDQISELRKSLPDRPSATAFFRPASDFNSRFKSAMQIDLCGVTLTNTINTQFTVLRDRLQSGAKIRFLIIDPESQAIDMSAQRSVNPKDTAYYQRRLEGTFADLTYLYKFNEDIKKSKKKGNDIGDVSVRMLTYAPSFGITSLDSDSKLGVVRVEIYPHRFGFKTPPSFMLTLENDKEWYSYFVEQFEQMWKTSKPWDPSRYIQKIPFEDNASS
jgi:hypothetical protein